MSRDELGSAGAQPGSRRPPVRGDDPFTTIADHDFLHWDLWFAIVLTRRFGASADALRHALLDLAAQPISGRTSIQKTGIEQRLSHLDDLCTRLDAARIGVRDLVERAEVTTYVENKARVKVLGDRHGVSEALDPTPAMIHTPRARLRERARRGNWEAFPVTPEPFDRVFRNCGRSKRGYSKQASFRVAQRLEERLAVQLVRTRRHGPAHELACVRGFLAGFLDVMDATDDSFGVLGELLIQNAGPAYLALDWRRCGIEPESYYRDFVEYVVWDDFGLVSSGRREGGSLVDRFCRAVPADAHELVDGIICEVAEELDREFDLGYQRAAAIQLRAALAVASDRFNSFVSIAAELGSDWWMPIERMARAAIAADRRDVAVAVFDAANVPGMHRAHLRDTHEKLRCSFPSGPTNTAEPDESGIH